MPLAAQAQFTGTNGKIYFYNTATTSIMKANADGTGQATVYNIGNSVVDEHFSISKDGTKIAYCTSAGLFTINVDGTGNASLGSTGCRNTAWSPDGTYIYYTLTSAPGGVSRAAVAGGAVSTVVASVSAIHPVVTPDGTKVVYDVIGTSGQNTIADIWITNTDGTGTPTNLTNNTVLQDSNPDISPDGQSITMIEIDTTSGTGAESTLQTMDIDGANKTVLLSDSLQNYFYFKYSPAGDKLIVHTFDRQDGVNSNFGISIANVDGSGITKVLTANTVGGVAWANVVPVVDPPSSDGGTGGVTVTTIAENDSQPSTNLTVAADTKLVVDGERGDITVQADGILGGHGTVGDITVAADGHLAPGNSPGCLSSSNVTLSSGANFDVDIAGVTACSGYDQQVVTGTVDVTGATLNLNVTYNAAQGTQFKIIDNDDTDAITGTFAGLAEGATVTAGGQDFTISYIGGDGNDVVLTAVGTAATPALPDAARAHLIAPITLALLAIMTVFGIEIRRRQVR